MFYLLKELEELGMLHTDKFPPEKSPTGNPIKDFIERRIEIYGWSVYHSEGSSDVRGFDRMIAVLTELMKIHKQYSGEPG